MISQSQNMASLSEHGIRLSAMSPSFLNSNSTSHIWPFSAVAELTDNASDPGVYAKQIWIDVIDEAGHPCLIFMDNGSGMTPNKLHKMLSFGFTEKGLGKATQQAIGVYGNGFKSGSMRLGRDALIFTKNGGCQSVGMLSQTYLENIKAQAVIVPIVPFNQQTKSLVVTEDSKASLAAILQHSIIRSLEQIHAHFDSMASKKGTKILIWNIRRTMDGKTEIDFDTDASDFRLPEIKIEELKKGLRNSGSPRAEMNVPDMYYSLRAYLSILYLKPRTQIILRGKKIIAKLVLKRLTHTEHDVYKPQFSKMKVKVTFGLNPTNKEQYGIMMYHKNRLIKAYEKVGCQLKASGRREGVGVIGIIECDFLKPAHNKQDFEYTKEYRLTLGALGIKLNEYWKEVTEKKAREREFQAVDRDEDEDVTNDGPMWLQCEECLKWRKVLAGHNSVFPESWHCSQNPNPHYRSCSFPEEAEENEELLTPSYQKKHKKQEHVKGRKRENSLEVCAFQDQAVQHQLLSRSASEPIQPTFQSSCSPERCHTEDNTPKHGQTNTSRPADQHTDTHLKDEAQNRVLAEVPHKQLKAMGRDTVIKDKRQITQGWMRVKNVTHSPSHKTEETDTSEETDVEPVERREESIDILSHKRKPAFLSNSVKKKLCLLEERQPDSDNMAEEMDPHKQTQVYEHQHQVEKPGGGAREIPTHLTLTHSFTSTQNVILPPLNQAEEPQRTTLPLTGNDREVKVQKLADLEKKVQGLRRLLGLQVTEASQGTVTTVDCSTEKPEELPLPAACREVGCQTNMGEISSSSCSLTHTVMVQDQRALCEPSEQNKNESGRRIRDREAYEDNRSAEESLRSVRNNLVVLFTALLPQLDLTGISLDTTDVDSILQQIIDVNSLKL